MSRATDVRTMDEWKKTIVGGGQKIVKELDILFLGGIPINRKICEDSDRGTPFIIEHADSSASKAFIGSVKRLRSS